MTWDRIPGLHNGHAVKDASLKNVVHLVATAHIQPQLAQQLAPGVDDPRIAAAHDLYHQLGTDVIPSLRILAHGHAQAPGAILPAIAPVPRLARFGAARVMAPAPVAVRKAHRMKMNLGGKM